MMYFDATGLHASAMYDENRVNFKIDGGFRFKPYMNDVYDEAFNNQSFQQDGNENAIIKIKYYNPPDLVFQHFHVKEKVKKHRS